jgi:hypothetical protein
MYKSVKITFEDIKNDRFVSDFSFHHTRASHAFILPSGEASAFHDRFQDGLQACREHENEIHTFSTKLNA